MGITWDERAPIHLSEARKSKLKGELDQNDDVLRLRAKQEKYNQRIPGHHQRIEDAKGTQLYSRYDDSKRQIHSLTNVLRTKKEDQVILKSHDIKSHDINDNYDVDRQFDGADKDFTCRPVVDYEFKERATIAKLLNEPLHELKEAPAEELSMQLINSLIGYCNYVKIRQDDTYVPRKLKIKVKPPAPVAIPMVCGGLVCLICIGNYQLSWTKVLLPEILSHTVGVEQRNWRRMGRKT
jgi:hypothetical protein